MTFTSQLFVLELKNWGKFRAFNKYYFHLTKKDDQKKSSFSEAINSYYGFMIFF